MNTALWTVQVLRGVFFSLNGFGKAFCYKPALWNQALQEVPWKNNATERVIGRMKMRARTVRGYKSWPGMQNGLMLAGMCTR